MQKKAKDMTASINMAKEQEVTVAAVSAKLGRKARIIHGIDAPWMTEMTEFEKLEAWKKAEEARILGSLEAMKRAEYDRKHAAIKLEKRARQSAIKGWTKVAIKNAIQDDFFVREERLKQT